MTIRQKNPVARAGVCLLAGVLVLLGVALSWSPGVAVAQDPNAFNRLMKPPSKRNPPPTADGIHDPAGAGAKTLQPPKDSFSSLPSGSSGNYVDWVKALEGGKITPRYDRTNPDVEPIVMDLNIVREVKGSMPNVVYPHKQHTEWLDCSNCHPAIFIPQKGANNISMASILLGEKCGVCHGKVAFPVAECRRCHSQTKDKSGQVTKTEKQP
ncbi:MAG: c(7)-type cytochrome triheme domain-containing protein [Gammaproteobacteria bacterium]